MLDQVQRLAVAELVIYSIFFLIGVFVLVRHGRRGFIAWFFFLAFCILRLVASGMRVTSNTITGAIINSVGLAGLLLATLGTIHEA
jgi:prolipoprotein diacylglyceryltransferase